MRLALLAALPLLASPAAADCRIALDVGHHLAEPGETSARGVYRYDGLAVLRLASMPSVLIEAGIIVNRDDELKLASPAYRAALAQAVAAAARAHCERQRELVNVRP